MPFTATCPDCSNQIEVPERLRGRTLRCKLCQATFVADEDEAPARRSREDEEDRPPRRSRDDDEDDRPRRRRWDDEPVRRPRPRSAGRNWVLWAGVGGGLAALAGVGVLIVVLVGNKKAAGDRGGPGGGDQAADQDSWKDLLGDVPGAKPPVTKADPATGLAFRVPVAPSLSPSWIGMPAQPSGFVALAFNSRDDLRDNYAGVIDRTTGRPVGKQTWLGLRGAAAQISLTPDGKTLSAHTGSIGFHVPEIRVWDAVTGRPVGSPFTPYKGQPVEMPRPPPNAPQPPPGLKPPDIIDTATVLIWHAWAAPGRLLTVAGDTRFDIWAMPDARPVGSLGPPPKDERRSPFPQDELLASARGGGLEFALSPDGGRIGLPRGGRIVILDTATGRELGRTPPFTDNPGRTIKEPAGIAFSPDGSRLAATSFGEDRKSAQRINLMVVSGTTGALLSSGALQVQMWDGSIGWWGPDLLVSLSAGGDEAAVYDAPTGRLLARVKPTGAGSRFRYDGTDGLLWAFFDGGERGKNAAAGPSYVCAFTPPARVKTAGGKTLRATPDGIE